MNNDLTHGQAQSTSKLPIGNLQGAFARYAARL